MSRNEYEIEFDYNGSVKEVKYYWDNNEKNEITLKTQHTLSANHRVLAD